MSNNLPPSKKPCISPGEEDPAVSRFREYLRINTISVPTPNSSGAQPDYGMTCMSGWGLACHAGVLGVAVVA